jgi:transketolase
MRDTFVRTLLEIAKHDKNVHLVTGDLGFGVLNPFWDELPNQITNVGIAEQNMTGFATGMALEGKIVFTYSIGNFPTLRALEQIRNDAAYHEANVKIVCVGGGFAYGSLGMSHHATEDLSIIRSLPNVKVIAPGDLIETKAATQAIYETRGTFYLRLGRGGEKRIHDSIADFKIGKSIKVLDGEDIAIFSTGAIFDEVIEAVYLLNENNVFPIVHTFPTVKPIDTDSIIKIANLCNIIVTIEEHNIIGGLGSAVSEVLSENDLVGVRLIRLGIQDTYSSIVGNQKYLRDVYGISAEKIRDKIMSYLNRNQGNKNGQ